MAVTEGEEPGRAYESRAGCRRGKEHLSGHRAITADSARGQHVRGTVKPAKGEAVASRLCLFCGGFNHPFNSKGI